jgi:putative ABC transport system permease protein
VRSLWRDFRFAARLLRKAPGFTVTTVVTLGLGIGATTAIFSVVRGVLLRPLAYPDPERIVMVCETNPERPAQWCGASPANWDDWRRLSRTLRDVGLARSWPFGIRRDGRSQGVAGGIATPGLFQVFAARPEQGRLFLPRDIEPGNEHVAMVSDEFWRSDLGASPNVLGRRLEIDGESYEIIGVLPAGFEVPDLAFVKVWIPLWPERRHMRGWRGFTGFGRLRAGVSLTQANGEMQSIRDALAKEFPEDDAAWGVRVDSLHERTVRAVRPALLVFMAAVLLMLLIACSNVANLFLARASAREREFAVRLAMGAGRARLVRQLLVEALLHAALGGVLGVLGATWAVDLFSALAPSWFPRLDSVRLDAQVLAFTVGISALTSLLFGLAPLLTAARLNPSEALQEGRGSGGLPGAGRIREALAVVEIALACVLLVGAGLLMRSFANLLDWRPGFERSNLLMVQVFSSPGKYPRIEPVIELYRRGVEEIRGVPSVVAASAGSALPLNGGDGDEEFVIEGRPAPRAGTLPTAWWFDVSPGYFRTLGVPLVRGRAFTPADGRGAPKVAIINETMARRYWPHSDPLGQRVHMVPHQATFEIVGVVGDVHPFRPDEAPRPEIYWPFAQVPRWAIILFARTSGPPERAVPAIRARLEALDPDMDIGRALTMEELVARQLVSPRFNLCLMAILALAALVLALVGIYGVMSFFIARRTREIGVRMALGAHPAGILRMVLRRGLILAGLGLLAGLAGALAATRLLRALLVGVAPTDPWTFAAIAPLLLAVAMGACYIPARRATRVDPFLALRHE